MFFIYLLVVSVVFYCSQKEILGGFPKLLDVNISINDIKSNFFTTLF